MTDTRGKTAPRENIGNPGMLWIADNILDLAKWYSKHTRPMPGKILNRTKDLTFVPISFYCPRLWTHNQWQMVATR